MYTARSGGSVGPYQVSATFQNGDPNPRVFSPSVLSVAVLHPSLPESQTYPAQKVALLGRCPEFNDWLHE